MREDNTPNKSIMETYKKYRWLLWFFAGLAAVFVFLSAYYILREDAYFMIHDELDDGIFKYVLYAKNLGSGNGFIPEFMGGQERYTITVSTAWGVLLYKFLSPYNAFLVMYTIVTLTGYLGVFLLGKELTDNAFASFFAASVFIYLPFKSMFGLNIVGFALLLWILIKLAKEKGKKTIIPFVLLVFYSTGITLAWGGFMAIGVLTPAIIVLLIIRKKVKTNIGNLIAADAILIVIQFVTSIDLIKSTFGPNAVLSHREELILNYREDLFALFKEMMYIGGSHSECCSKVMALSAPILIAGIPVLIYFLNKEKIHQADLIKKKYILLVIFYGANVLNSLFSCFWSYKKFVEFRQNAGGILKTFQLSRIYWMMPVCWMCVLVLEIAIILDIAKIFFMNPMFKKMRFVGVFPVICALALALVYSRNVYLSSPVYHNLRLLRFPETYHMDSWEKYYAENLFDKIDEAIGEDKSEYRVVCVGLDPAVPLFNGFYTLDGYSTDYPLEYKHEFREIIANELDKNDSMKGYFDNWGNRCYLYCAEKWEGNSDIEELNIDTAILKDMGAKYIFSDGQIGNAEEIGLKQLTDSYFTDNNTEYCIYVYKIGAN